MICEQTPRFTPAKKSGWVTGVHEETAGLHCAVLTFTNRTADFYLRDHNTKKVTHKLNQISERKKKQNSEAESYMRDGLTRSEDHQQGFCATVSHVTKWTTRYIQV